MKIVKDLNLPFYLTGGTALSRFYFSHRFSDDLDFFVNSNPNFNNYIRVFVKAVDGCKLQSGISIINESVISSPDFYRFAVKEGDTILKIDFINDVSFHCGELLNNKVFGPIDSWVNILSNKLSAIYRLEIKDFVDIWTIAKNRNFVWNEIINDAKNKEMSIDPVEICDLFISFPFQNLHLIKWTSNVDYSNIQEEFSILANDILLGKTNSLFSGS